MPFTALVMMVWDGMVDMALNPTAGLGLPYGILALAGLTSLAGGLYFTWRRPHRMLWWAAGSVALSLALLALGSTDARASSETARATLYSFYALQLGCTAILIWGSAGSRVAASLLAVFCLSHAWFCGFIGIMAITGTWL